VASRNFTSHIRWRICALLFFATTINYMDRQILGILAPDLQKEIGWTEGQYGLIVAAFTATYAIGLMLAGRFLDFVGTKKGFGIAVGGWSLAAAAHALATTPLGFGISRAVLGLTEAGNFPSALKTTAEWFPKKERSFATGLFNCGSNVGVICAALLVPFVTLRWGWRAAFIVQGALGLVWLALWWLYYKKPSEHPAVTAEERTHIESDQDNKVSPRLPFKQIISYRQTWAYAAAKMMTDPVWWFYLFWLPKYLSKDHGVTLSTLAAPLIVVYILADIGSVAGGWLSIFFEKRGKSHLEARKLAMLVCALSILPTLALPFVGDMWSAVLLVGLAAAGHQGWSANAFSLPSDLFPPSSVGSVAGFGHSLGSFAGMLFQAAIGYFLQWNGSNYAPVFFVCGSAYIAAWFVVTRLLKNQTVVART
jgi:MFS transporter, ACS family, hexuronate transporter